LNIERIKRLDRRAFLKAASVVAAVGRVRLQTTVPAAPFGP
jgi:hypothetical protein